MGMHTHGHEVGSCTQDMQSTLQINHGGGHSTMSDQGYNQWCVRDLVNRDILRHTYATEKLAAIVQQDSTLTNYNMRSGIIVSSTKSKKHRHAMILGLYKHVYDLENALYHLVVGEKESLLTVAFEAKGNGGFFEKSDSVGGFGTPPPLFTKWSVGRS